MLKRHLSVNQTAFLDKSLRHETRFLAIILLKNGIDKYWRQHAKHAIKPPEKQLIRSRLLQGSVGEEEKSLSLHNALVTAKIVRIDYPHDWPDALQTVIGATRASKDGDPAHLSGALLVLLRVVKELGTARMRKSQTALQAVTPELVQLLGEIYTQKTSYWQQFFASGQGDEDDADYAMQNSLTALKILRRLVTVGYEQPHEDEMVQGFWSVSQSQFDQFLAGVGHDSSIPVPFQDLVGKHLIQFTKLHIDMCQQHPASFTALPNSIPLVRAYWGLVKDFSDVFEKSGGIKEKAGETSGGNPKHEGPISEKLALKGLLLLRGCIAIAYSPAQTFKYRSPEAKQLEKQAISAIKNELLTTELLLDIVQVIISKLFVFRKSDLEAWEEDPETWESQERNEGQAFEWAVRPCAERLLVDLLTHYKELGKPLITYCELAAKLDMDIVTKEAAYCALGCAAAIVHETFDFDRFLTTTLVKDTQIQDSMAKLLRRRISILLSQWIPIKISRENRLVVYEIFRHLMKRDDQHNDEVVRITAARQFKWIADEFEFSADDFLPFAADYFTILVNLLDEVDSDETKLAILSTIRVIVGRMGTFMSQFGDGIMAILPNLWEAQGSEEYMMKQAILSIMSTLVESMRAESTRYQGIVLPLLTEALNPDSALHLHLIEESVELWKSIVSQSAPPLAPELIGMVKLALPLLEYDSYIATQCLEITKSYIILAPTEILSDALRRPTLEALAKTLDLRSREQNKLGGESIELIIRTAERVGGTQGVSIVVQDMMEIGLLRTILEQLHEAWEASESTGPNRKVSKINSIKETDYFALLARITITSPEIFATMLTSLGGSFEQVWGWLSTQWFANFDRMAELDRQKLSCLALTRLCELPSPVQELVLARLHDYLSMWTSVITELLVDGASGSDTLVWTEPVLLGFSNEGQVCTPLERLEIQLAEDDPIHTVYTYDFVRARLGDLVRRVGGEQVFEANWAVNVDKEVLTGFRRLSEPQRQEGTG